MSQATNPYCERLGIAVPSLAAVRAHPEANTYTLLIVALLQRGQPMTLAEVALDFEAAGIVEHADDAYFSLSRCRPARAPVICTRSIPTITSSTCGRFASDSGRRGSRDPSPRQSRQDHRQASGSASRSSIRRGAMTPT